MFVSERSILSPSSDISKVTAKEKHVHGKRSEVILFVFNMYLQQGGHRQKRLTTWWKLKQNRKEKKKKLHLLSMQFSHLFFPISNIFLSKETLQYKETYEEGTSYFYYTRHLGSETTLTWDTKQLPKDRLPHIQYCFVIKRKKKWGNQQKKSLLLSKQKNSSLNPPCPWMLQYYTSAQ